MKTLKLEQLPFIASVIWQENDYRCVNHVVERINKLFVDYINIDFSKNKIAILSVSP